VFFQVLWVSSANHHFNIHLMSSSPQSSVQLFLSTPLRCRGSNSTAPLILHLVATEVSDEPLGHFTPGKEPQHPLILIKGTDAVQPSEASVKRSLVLPHFNNFLHF